MDLKRGRWGFFVMKFKGSIYYEHTPSKSVCLYQGGKKGRRRLFVIAGQLGGIKFVVTKERFRREFKRLEMNEALKRLQEDKPKAKVIMPGEKEFVMPKGAM